MTRLLAKTTGLALAGLAMAAAASLTAFGSAGRSTELGQTAAAQTGDNGAGRGDIRLSGGGAFRGNDRRIAKVGEDCGPATGRCEDPAFCDDSRHCAVGDAGLGKACARHAECQTPLVCPWATHVCSAPAKIGQSCHTNPGGRSECAAGAGCNGTKCVAHKPDGASCLADEECKSGACQGSACAKTAGPGLADRDSPAR
jgi:hypothetical protein